MDVYIIINWVVREVNIFLLEIKLKNNKIYGFGYIVDG